MLATPGRSTEYYHSTRLATWLHQHRKRLSIWYCKKNLKNSNTLTNIKKIRGMFAYITLLFIQFFWGNCEHIQNVVTRFDDSCSMVAMAMDPMENRESASPFQCCRLFLNQLGFTQWGMRPHFDLLKKSEKLLRELKHLDKQMWYV